MLYLTTLAGVIALLFSGCNTPSAPAGPAIAAITATPAVCNPNNGGGDLNCPCTLNAQCNNFDNDTRLIICNVPSGGTVGVCYDCFAEAAGTGTRPIGCFCSTSADCASGSACNGFTCQAPQARGYSCHQSSDCGTDALGTMTCLPTENVCGPLSDGLSCTFQTDCLTGEVCTAQAVCSSGGSGATCTKDSDCNAPLICYEITHECSSPVADGSPCERDADCSSGVCNLFDGTCGLVGLGDYCIPGTTPSECESPYVCTPCSTGEGLCLASGGTC